MTVFEDPAIVESSGLVVVDGLFVTTNDSGDSGRVFTVDPATGETVGVTHWSDDPVDVEALAPAGGGEVWVGDIGDNRAERASISVVRVPVGRGEPRRRRHVVRARFPGGPATPSRCWPTRRPAGSTSSARASSAAPCTPPPTAADRPAQPAHRGRPGARDRDRRGVLPRRPAHHRARLHLGGRLLVPRPRPRWAGSGCPTSSRARASRSPGGRHHLRLVGGPARAGAADRAAARRPERHEAAGRQRRPPHRASRPA